MKTHSGFGGMWSALEFDSAKGSRGNLTGVALNLPSFKVWLKMGHRSIHSRIPNHVTIMIF